MTVSMIDVGPFFNDSLLLPQPQSGARVGIPIAIDGVANHITVFPFYLNRVMRLRGAGLSIATLQAGVNAYTGIYDQFGNFQCGGKFSCASVADLQSALVAPGPTGIVLNPSLYLFTMGCEGITAAANGGLFDSGAFNLIPGTGVAVNQIAGGAMPATLGSPLPAGFGFPGSMPFGTFF